MMFRIDTDRQQFTDRLQREAELPCIADKTKALQVVIRIKAKSTFRSDLMIDHLLLFVVADSIRRYVSKLRKFTYAVHGYSSFIFCINLSLYSPCKKLVFIPVWRSFSSMSANRRLISEYRGSFL